DFRRSEWARYKKLYDDRTIPKDQFDEKEKQLKAALAAHAVGTAAVETAVAMDKVAVAKKLQAAADVDAARARAKVAAANLDRAETMVKFATIRAPFDGVITRRNVHPGAFITPSEKPLLTIARLNRLRVVADIPPAEAAAIKVGQKATLRVNGFAYQPTGKVDRTAVTLDIDSLTRTLRVEMDLWNAPPELAGGYGFVTILVNEPERLMVDSSAVVPGETPTVMMVKDGVCCSCPVRLGISEGGRVQIFNGLNEGDLVILPEGSTFPNIGQAVSGSR
ncbi:MAG: efflux RND transporter periplasmic adaptor subunit, partial [Gemmataceae bacterium]|nr:efflux RND transporter periplasmic adaptor subunit [Gemmataceae bacterium]